MLKRSNIHLSKRDPSIGFFTNNKCQKIELNAADAALATIPCIPHELPLFQQNEEIEDPWNTCYSAREVWSKLKNPITTVPGHHVSLNHLRELAEKGITTAIPYNMPRPYPGLLKAHQLLAAGPVAYAYPQSKKVNLPGVVFHPGNSTLTAHVRGDANPHLGYGRQHGHNKLWEWKFISRIDPKVMAKTIAIDELPIWTDPGLVKLRRSIRKNMIRIINRKSKTFTKKSTQELICYLRYIFAALRIKFPEGAFIKPVESSCSGDFNRLITTMDSKEEDMAAAFARHIVSILHDLSKSSRNIKSPIMRTILLSQSSPIFLTVHDLLFKPREVIGQAALKLAKTECGVSFEVRVDFMHGKALKSMMRYAMADYYPRETKAAADFLDQFFQKANYQNRMLCGGADLALGQDGKWHIIEFNLGAESIGLKFGTNWNCYVSNFLGRNTDLINTYETIFAAPLDEQQKFLKGLQQTVLNHPDVDDLSEVYLWFQNRYCELFSTNPTYKERDLILEKLTTLFSVLPPYDQGYATSLIQTSKSYMNRELTCFNSSCKQLFFQKYNLKDNSDSTGPERTLKM